MSAGDGVLRNGTSATRELDGAATGLWNITHDEIPGDHEPVAWSQYDGICKAKTLASYERSAS